MMNERMHARKKEGRRKKIRKRVRDFNPLLHVEVKVCVFVMLDAVHYQKSVTLEPHGS